MKFTNLFIKLNFFYYGNTPLSCICEYINNTNQWIYVWQIDNRDR